MKPRVHLSRIPEKPNLRLLKDLSLPLPPSYSAARNDCGAVTAAFDPSGLLHIISHSRIPPVVSTFIGQTGVKKGDFPLPFESRLAVLSRQGTRIIASEPKFGGSVGVFETVNRSPLSNFNVAEIFKLREPVIVSPAGGRIAAHVQTEAGADWVSIWDVGKYGTQLRASVNVLEPPLNLEFSPDGKWLLIHGPPQEGIRLVDLENKNLPKEGIVEMDALERYHPTKVEFDASGRFLSGLSDDNHFIGADLHGYVVDFGAVGLLEAPNSTLTWVQPGKVVVLHAGPGKKSMVYSIPDKKILHEFIDEGPSNHPMVAVSADGLRLAHVNSQKKCQWKLVEVPKVADRKITDVNNIWKQLETADALDMFHYGLSIDPKSDWQSKVLLPEPPSGFWDENKEGWVSELSNLDAPVAEIQEASVKKFEMALLGPSSTASPLDQWLRERYQRINAKSQPGLHQQIGKILEFSPYNPNDPKREIRSWVKVTELLEWDGSLAARRKLKDLAASDVRPISDRATAVLKRLWPESITPASGE